jgi:hypothetical protein
MPKHIDNKTEVMKWIEEKQQLEVMLAWDLLETFNNTPALINPLRAMAGKAVDEMLEMDTDAVNAAIAEERGRPNMQVLTNRLVLTQRDESHDKKIPRSQVLQVNKQEDLERIINIGTLDAQYCSDIVRLYGTSVEKAAGRGISSYKKLDKEKSDLRKGGQDVWNKGETGQQWGRHRGGADFAPKGKVDVGLKTISKRPASSTWCEKQIEDANITNVHRFLIYQQGGQSGFRLYDTSTVGKIDRVFGTVPAADISGTTTDNVFFISRFSEVIKRDYTYALDPIFHLLPLGTIVAGAHHSLLEVALALSLNKKVDYQIGFYETLMPNRSGFPNHPGITNIKEALVAAEKHRYNHLMLVYYESPGKVAGCYKFDSFEQQFRKFARATDVLTLFRAAPAWPSQRQLFKICANNSLF